MIFPPSPSFRHLLAASALVAGAALPAQAGILKNAEISGIFETHTAVGFQDGRMQTSEFTLTPELRFDMGSRSRFTFIGRVRGDLYDRLEPGKPTTANRSGFSDRLSVGDNLEAEIREAYIDTEIGSTYLRLGKQQIVWGQADGLKVLDILNPQSFREFVLPEFEDSRIPLWSFNAEIPLRSLTLQVVWIPDTSYDDIPGADSVFAFTSPLVVPSPPDGIPLVSQSYEKPDHFLSDSDLGLKLSAFLGGWDLSLNYAYHYFDRPVVRRTASSHGIHIQQSYERSHLIGGTFSNVFGDFTLRGELGLSTNRYHQTSVLSDTDGVVRSNDFSYVLGLDYSGFTDWFISTQIFQSFLTNHQPGMVRDSVDTNMTFLVRRDLMNEALTAEALLIQSLSGGDGLLQLAITYEWTSNIRLKLGADIFYGKKQGLFGQFRKNDRLTAGIELAF